MTPVTYSVADILLPDDAAPTTTGSAVDRETAEVRGLIDRARAGDETAFGVLIERHQRVAIRTAFAALGRREDAEDAAQDAFVQAWRALAGFRGDAQFRTWLLRIVWHRALDRRRSRQQWWKRSASSGDERDVFDAVVAEQPDPEQAIAARDLARRIRREILALSPTLRDTLLLAASGEHTYEEIGSMLGAPTGTIKWRVAEARRLIALKLQP
jgi:RNA polymerase sigma-70 factor (ECF subfamily)